MSHFVVEALFVLKAFHYQAIKSESFELKGFQIPKVICLQPLMILFIRIGIADYLPADLADNLIFLPENVADNLPNMPADVADNLFNLSHLPSN